MNLILFDTDFTDWTSPNKVWGWVAPQEGEQREKNLIFDFFLQKKSKIKFFSLYKFFLFPKPYS
jgi:hypothetical protein